MAVTWDRIADIAYDRGDYDEALRIRREVQLPVYERLGDTRSTAVTWGHIADIAYRRGDYDEALRIRRDAVAGQWRRVTLGHTNCVCAGDFRGVTTQLLTHCSGSGIDHRRASSRAAFVFGTPAAENGLRTYIIQVSSAATTYDAKNDQYAEVSVPLRR